MTLAILDTRGRLQEFHAVPPQFDPDEKPAAAPKWAALFDAAGLPLSTFSPVAPQWTPRDFADARAAWEGPLPDRPEYRVRVEAAAYRGRPVSFLIAGPWTRPTRMQAATRTTTQTVVNGFVVVFFVALVCAALLLARHNLRVNRADRRGAARLAVFVLSGYAASWVVGAHHVPDINAEVDSFARNFGSVLLGAGILWVTYMALEPYVRRFWPDGILGWVRLMSGHLKDPRVGHDVLLGCVIAVGMAVLEVLYNLLPPLAGRPPAVPTFHAAVAALTGSAALSTMIFDQSIGGIFVGMFAVLGYVLLRLTLRRTSFAVAGVVVLLAIVRAQQVLTSTAPMWMAVLFQLAIIAIITTVIVRYGLLVTAIASAVGNVLGSIPLTLSLSHWTAPTSNLTIAALLALTLFGFYASRAGQPLFGDFGAKPTRPW